MRDKFRVRLYQPGDYAFVVPSEVHSGEGNIGERIERLNIIPNNNIYTCLSGNRPIAIIGWTLLFPGVADLWSLVSEEIKKYGKSFYKFCMTLMEFGNYNLGIHRFQMTVRVGNKELIRWSEALHMKCEGLMEKFGPDKSDYFLFARVY